jgi:hypothetical protein
LIDKQAAAFGVTRGNHLRALLRSGYIRESALLNDESPPSR